MAVMAPRSSRQSTASSGKKYRHDSLAGSGFAVFIPRVVVYSRVERFYCRLKF